MSSSANPKSQIKNPKSPFRLLSAPAHYVACDWDVAADATGRDYWVPFFKKHFRTLLGFGVNSAVARGETPGSAQRRAFECGIDFDAVIDAFAAGPKRYCGVTILALDNWRDQALRRYGFVDPFVDLKERENEAMLPRLPALCRQIDAISGAKEQLETLVRGVFAGNIFDMGSGATAAQFADKSPDFATVRAKLPARPWLIDDLDALAERLLVGPRHRKAVVFIDNAGSDFVLGMVPLVRWLAGRGTAVVIAANERPTLNDMTIADVRAWWPRIVAAEPTLASLPISHVSTGTGEPLIDLSVVSEELNVAADGADLVILEGMGRAVESNLDASFTCDALSIAMVKDSAVAGRIGGKLFDVVCKWRVGTASAPLGG